MSVSSNSRKENTESYAAKQMRSTMGVAPALDHLAKPEQVGRDLPSDINQSNDIDPQDVLPIDTEPNPAQNDARDHDTELVEVTDESLARDEDTGLSDDQWERDRTVRNERDRDTGEYIQPS
ncbi:hypothetical protein GCM10027347_25320 [Larkinella harenae]